jgi:hypothetical protein
VLKCNWARGPVYHDSPPSLHICTLTMPE